MKQQHDRPVARPRSSRGVQEGHVHNFDTVEWMTNTASTPAASVLGLEVVYLKLTPFLIAQGICYRYRQVSLVCQMDVQFNQQTPCVLLETRTANDVASPRARSRRQHLPLAHFPRVIALHPQPLIPLSSPLRHRFTVRQRPIIPADPTAPRLPSRRARG